MLLLEVNNLLFQSKKKTNFYVKKCFFFQMVTRSYSAIRKYFSWRKMTSKWSKVTFGFQKLPACGNCRYHIKRLENQFLKKLLASIRRKVTQSQLMTKFVGRFSEEPVTFQQIFFHSTLLEVDFIVYVFQISTSENLQTAAI